MILCSNCRENPPVRGQRYCLACKRAYTRKWRKGKKLDYTQKHRARGIAGVYHRRGKLVPELCQRCGEHKVEKHHPDYLKPLEVEWLCRECHLSLHKKLKDDQRIALNELLSRIINEATANYR